MDIMNKIKNIAIRGNMHWTLTMCYTWAICAGLYVISVGSSDWSIQGSFDSHLFSVCSPLGGATCQPCATNSQLLQTRLLFQTPNSHTHCLHLDVTNSAHRKLLIRLQKLLYFPPYPDQPSLCSGQNSFSHWNSTSSLVSHIQYMGKQILVTLSSRQIQNSVISNTFSPLQSKPWLPLS